MMTVVRLIAALAVCGFAAPSVACDLSRAEHAAIYEVMLGNVRSYSDRIAQLNGSIAQMEAANAADGHDAAATMRRLERHRTSEQIRAIVARSTAARDMMAKELLRYCP